MAEMTLEWGTMTLERAKLFGEYVSTRPLDERGKSGEAARVLFDALTAAEHDRDAYKARLNATIAAGDAAFAKYAQASVALEAAEAKVAALEAEVAKAREAGFREAVEKAVQVVRTSINEQDDRAVEYRSKGRIEHGRSRDVAAYHLRKGEKAIRALAPAATPVEPMVQTDPAHRPTYRAPDGSHHAVERFVDHRLTDEKPSRPFDAEAAFKQFRIELQVDDCDFTDMRAILDAALAAGRKP